MKITESKLRQMIRGVIKEFTSSATVVGAKPSGYKSADTKSKESDYNTKSDDYDTKKADWDTKKADLDAFDSSKKYRRAAKGGGYQYSATASPGWSVNPDYTAVSNPESIANRAKDEAETARDSAKTTRDTAREKDLAKTVVKQKRQTGGGKGGFGKGKSAGKGKGKGKKGKKKN